MNDRSLASFAADMATLRRWVAPVWLALSIGCGPHHTATPAAGPPSTSTPVATVSPPPSSAASANPTPPSTLTLPFTLEVVEKAGSKLPALQSYAAGQAKGKWLLLGGRIAGLHGFNTGTNNFPRATANTQAFAVDPDKNSVLGAVDLVANLPAAIAGPLTATNAEFTQVGNQLYVVGGYGKDLVSGKLTTFGTVTTVDVEGLLGAISASNKNIAGFFKQSPAPDNRLKVTGGSLKQNAGIFYLVFGQNFDGEYSIENGDYNRAGGQFQQYTEKVRVFTLTPSLAIKDFNQVDGGYDPSLPYHRRDLNVVDVIGSDGKTPGATVYGGVFMAGQVAGHTAPIDIDFGNTVKDATVSLSHGFQQALSQYDCAHVSVYDATSTSTFTTLLGGISQYHYDSAKHQLIRDAIDLSQGIDGLPFIDTVSTLQRKPNGAFAQFIQPQALPGLLGAEAQFLRSSQLSSGQAFDNGVINLPGITTRTLIGHIYGGIESFGPYSTYGSPPPGSKASARLFDVYLSPTPGEVLPMPPLPTSTTPYPPPH